MPIVISRNGPVEPKVAGALSQQDKDALWEQIVRNWCNKHPDRLRDMAGGSDPKEVPA